MDGRDLGRLGRALWAAGVAWMLALATLSLYLPFHRTDPSPPPDIIPAYADLFLDNRPTKYFFAAFFLLGPACAYAVSRSALAQRLSGPAAWVGVGLLVPAASRCTAHVFSRLTCAWDVLVSCACILMPVVISAVLAGLRTRPVPTGHEREPGGAASHPLGTSRHRRSACAIAVDLFAAVLIGGLLVPSSVGAAAARVGLNFHPVAYFIGPALYSYGDRLTPGIDYYSQYGLGPGCLFSFLLRERAQTTLENYIWLCAALCGVFFFSLYLLLRRPLGRTWSLGVALFTLIFLFATNAAFLCPSSWVIRFPLLPAFVGLAAHALRHPEHRRAAAWAGACTGLSIFWNTETGLSMLCAGGLVFLIHDVSRARRLLGPLAFAGTALLTVLLAGLLCYHERACSLSFVRGMLRPLLVYGGGFGGFALDWDVGWNRVYAVAFPLLGAATVGWGLAELRSNEQARRTEAIFPLLFALLGLCFLVKWVNRSYQVVWMQNAVPLVVVTGWWLRRACRAVAGAEGQPNWGLRRCLAAGLAGLCAALACAYLYYVKDPRFDEPLAARAFWEHPSLAKTLLTRERPNGWPADLGAVSAGDVALIRRLTCPDERVALISPDDWVYLLAAQRAPKFEIIPGGLLFLGREVGRSFAGIDRLFVETDGRGNPRLPSDWQRTFPVWTYASALLARDFVLEVVGDRLAVYRRRLRGQARP